MRKLNRILLLLACMMIIAVVSVRRSNCLLGHTLATADTVAVADTMTSIGDTIIVHTALLASDVQGYAGATPHDIYVYDGKVVKIVALPNDETPSFWEEAAGLARERENKTLDEAMNVNVDAVSGATFSSEALKENIRRGVSYAAAHKTGSMAKKDVKPGYIAALLVVLLGMIMPLILKGRRWHTMQIILNIVVLGLWTGTFLSHAMLINVMTNGLPASGWLLVSLLLVVGFIYPVFGRQTHYCTHICPLGSAQELVYRLPGFKLRISTRVVVLLTYFRRIIWVLLIMMLVFDVWAEWTDYEPFSAFIIEQADTAVLVFASLILLLSIFTPRPYCRFLCPTGTLLKMK